MDKLKLIIKREFLAKVKNKSFIVMTILSPLLMVGLLLLIVFLNQKNSEEVRTVAFVDESNLLATVLEDTNATKYIDLTDLGIEEAKKQTEGNFYGLLFIKKSDSLINLSKGIQFYSEDTPSLNLLGSLENKLEKKIRNLKIEQLNFDLDKIKATETSVSIATENFAGEKSSKIGSILRMIAGGGFGYLIFMFIIIYGTSVMRSVIEEKTSRIIEVIISSVKPFQLMLGKILGNAFAGILQFIIWAISAGLLLTIITYVFGIETTSSGTAMGQINPEMIEQMHASSASELQVALQEIKNLPILTMFFSFIIYFIGGYLIYSSIYAAIGAAVDSETDTQQFMMPVMLPLIIAIYVGFSVIENPHGPIALAFSLFPLTSPIVMLMRIPFGVPWWQIITSMLLLIGTFILIVWFAAKIYRVGILMYGKKPTYKELYKWLKY
ncbi:MULTISPECIES: ABC transporter permease [Flavobacteriaceae]|uniref:ABC transporter permease n=2 Tax=Flavobacteriaceae TaxID=49546 RepID=A0A4Y8AQG4_9FLAO|nr:MULTISPECIES: ABC transporter permease [Flavobacteriaceae]TEW71872.1 ABC transporter permease [Gramella jeungdoensis]GGK59995.1 ABC transporter permease [Lutibacter litoralis]